MNTFRIDDSLNIVYLNTALTNTTKLFFNHLCNNYAGIRLGESFRQIFTVLHRSYLTMVLHRLYERNTSTKLTKSIGYKRKYLELRIFATNI